MALPLTGERLELFLEKVFDLGFLQAQPDEFLEGFLHDRRPSFDAFALAQRRAFLHPKTAADAHRQPAFFFQLLIRFPHRMERHTDLLGQHPRRRKRLVDLKLSAGD